MLLKPRESQSCDDFTLFSKKFQRLLNNLLESLIQQTS